MDYQYDIFISYKRTERSLEWIQRHFYPLLRDCVQEELCREPQIFVDKEIESGVSWAPQLGASLANSRILIPLLGKNYFHSDWCCKELSMMLDREQQLRKRTAENPRGLIVPVIIYDCDELPPPISSIQFFELRKYFSSRMPKYGESQAEMEAILLREAPAIATAINTAPPGAKNGHYK